jgi:DNA-directed RNA polymerase specialized sigma subunit
MLTGELSRSPTDIEIAQALNIPLAAYQQLLGELKGLEMVACMRSTLGMKGKRS